MVSSLSLIGLQQSRDLPGHGHSGSDGFWESRARRGARGTPGRCSSASVQRPGVE